MMVENVQKVSNCIKERSETNVALSSFHQSLFCTPFFYLYYGIVLNRVDSKPSVKMRYYCG
jgi:hypothetical protein